MTSSTESAQARVLEGQHDSYTLVAPLGRGGFGVTAKARRASDGEVVVVKQLRVERVDEWKAVELFEREGQALAALDHAAIPAYVDSFTTDDSTGFVLVQTYVEGPTLQELINAGQVPSPRAMFNWFWQLLEVCEYLHQQDPPVIHRDITPKNIILRDVDSGEAALIDFGTVQAKMISSTGISSTAAGTFGYAPPEQFIGHAMPNSDLFGLAMTFLALALSTPPERMPMVGGRVDVQAALAQAQGVDARLQLVLADMLHPAMERRPQSARQVMDRLLPLRRTIAPSAQQTADPANAATVQMDMSEFQAEDLRRMAQLRGRSAQGSAPPETSAEDASSLVKPWLEARQRAAKLGPDTGWTCAPPVPCGDLERVILSDSGSHALLIGYENCWLLDLETTKTQLLLDTAISDRTGAFSADGTLAVLCSGYEQLLHVIEGFAGGQPAQVRTLRVPQIESLDSSDLRVAVSPDHKMVAIAPEDPWNSASAEVLLVSPSDATVLQRVQASCSTGLSFSADGRYLICEGEILDEKGTTIFATSGSEGELDYRFVSVSPDCRRIAVSNEDAKEIEIGTFTDLTPLDWKSELRVNLAQRVDLPGTSGNIKGLRFSPDGQLLLVFWNNYIGDCSEYILVIDAHTGALRARLGSPINPDEGVNYVKGYGASADGRFVYVDANLKPSRWLNTDFRMLICWSIAGEVPVYVGMITMGSRLAGGGGGGLYIHGQKVDAQAAEAMGIELVESEDSPEVAAARAQFGRAPDDPAPDELPYARSVDGFFGRLDAALPLGAAGLVEVWERPDLIGAIFQTGEPDAGLTRDERAHRRDIDQRIRFFFELFRAGRISSREDVQLLADSTRGITHLLPVLVERAEAEEREKPRFGGGDADNPVLSRKTLLQACQELKALSPEAHEVLFEEMIENQRAAARAEAARQAQRASKPQEDFDPDGARANAASNLRADSRFGGSPEPAENARALESAESSTAAVAKRGVGRVFVSLLLGLTAIGVLLFSFAKFILRWI